MVAKLDEERPPVGAHMIETASIESLMARVQGAVVMPGDPSYDSVRSVWNGMIDRRPAVIVQCRSRDDVAEAITFARRHNLGVSIRGGGHGVAGKSVCDNGLMIDMSLMNGVSIDREKRIATVQSGALLGDLDRAAQAEGLVTTAGIDPRTGVAGLTLGGGVGFLARQFGLTIDNLLAADLVTANAEFIRASTSEHPDLFWGLRGGGGNFGVVTSFEFQLHEFGPNVLVAMVYFSADHIADALRLYRELMTGAPDEFACYALVVTVPPVEPFPVERHGATAIVLVASYSGDLDAGSSYMEPLAKFGDPIFKIVEPMPYVELQQTFRNGFPDGQRYYWKASYFKEITDEAIEDFARMTRKIPSPYSAIGFEPLGGAISRVDPSVTAFRHRDAQYALGIWSGWIDADLDSEHTEWTRALHEAMTSYASEGVYSNYLDGDEGDRIQSAFGENYERLSRIKAEYDPENFFRLNMNIAPAPEA